ncbi:MULTISPECIES: hypothetical protein [Bradyrhizobium]|uniref:hypothetical protein n=1 Tax=Bradyrhizobium TaxID=374 RepID=UPI00041BADF6|nr:MULTISPECIES: hypothetical protein [Bradyrhizobium]QOG18909.1 hypothetical protein FOM02_17790 [Bradyrhizobium sp. SEMIA]UFW53650.1 hypothetical protein BaraCB756_22570 [Bradyrhizobium arachidis]
MHLKRLLVAAVIVSALLAGYVAWPRHADLRAFDPAEMARLETAMWRDYYEERYGALFYHLYESTRTQFGFSPLKGLRIAISAAEAARTFQPTRSRQEADAALPPLIVYYGELSSAAPTAFDVEEAARLELDWWQARREAVDPRDYGLTIARVAELTYGRIPDSGIWQFGIVRAEAMAYRDARGAAITASDWGEIEAQLARAYRSLNASVSR